MSNQFDVFRIFMRATYLNQQIVNVFHYQNITFGGGDGTIGGLFTDFEATVIAALLPLVSAHYHIYELEGINLDSESQDEFRIVGVDYTGAVAGDCLPPNIGYRYMLVRETRDVRNGRKNFAGVPEAANALGVPDASILADAQNLADAMGEELNSGTTGWQPIIFRKPNDTIPRGAAFRVNEVVFKGFGTQNSRKIGVGV